MVYVIIVIVVVWAVVTVVAVVVGATKSKKYMIRSSNVVIVYFFIKYDVKSRKLSNYYSVPIHIIVAWNLIYYLLIRNNIKTILFYLITIFVN